MPRSLLIALFLCLLLSAAMGQTVPLPVAEPNDERKLIEAGARLYEEKKYDEAIATLKRALEINPENHGTYAMLGGVYLSQGKMDLASEALGKASSLDPQRYIYIYFKARADALRGAREEGLVAARKAIELSPLEADAHYVLVELLGIGSGNVKERTEALRRAVELKPEFLEEYKWAAYRLNSIGNDKKGAEEAFRIVLEVDPKRMAGRFDLGRMLVEQGRLKEARELWDGRTSDEDRTFPNFIVLLKRAENLVAAKEAYDKSPNDPETNLGMGFATLDGDHWVVDGRWEKAVVFFRKALELKPGFARAQFGICKALVEMADLNKSKNKELDEEVTKLRAMDVKLADEIVEYRKTYQGGIRSAPAGPPPPKKP